MTAMQTQIETIERATGRTVYVGKITFDDTIWAAVDVPGSGCRFQAPAKTEEEAVSALHNMVLQHENS